VRMAFACATLCSLLGGAVPAQTQEVSEEYAGAILGLATTSCSDMTRLVPAFSMDFEELVPHAEWVAGYWSGLNVRAMLEDQHPKEVGEYEVQPDKLSGELFAACISGAGDNLLQVASYIYFKRLPEKK
jgi:hypothetical protein